MKAYIYLYPIGRFFDFRARKRRKVFEDSNSSPGRINDIIDARYRQKGFTIYWLMPSKEDNPEEPDLSVFSNYITRHEGDVFLSAGISHKELTVKGIRPDYEFISGQIENLTEVVIGGFHQWECVDRLAQYFYQRGIPTFVDEDTTELFFKKTSFGGEIPLYREKVSLGTSKKERITRVIGEGFGIGRQTVENTIRMRKEKPWFK